MGMLIRRHRKGIDAARQAEVEPTIDPEPGSESLPTPPIVQGDTGVPPVDPANPVVPTGEVPAAPVEPPTGDEVIAEGTPGGSENIEDLTGAHDGQTVAEVQEEATEPTPEATEQVEPPKRNASKAEWLAFIGKDEDERTRDEIADSVLGPKQ